MESLGTRGKIGKKVFTLIQQMQGDLTNTADAEFLIDADSKR